MRRFSVKYIVLRTTSTVVGFAIILENLRRGIDFDLSFLLGYQTFLFAYLAFLIADSVSRFWWNRWRHVDAGQVITMPLAITVPGGENLSGIVHYPAVPAGATGSRGLVIASYGFNDNQFRATHVAQGIAAAGFTVVTWDYRGRGATAGSITDLEGHVDDLCRIIDHFSRADDGCARPVLLLGWSVGGMVSIQAGLHDARVSKIFAWSTWSDLRRRVLWRIYANPFALLRYFFKGELLYVSRDKNKKVSPVHYFESLAAGIGGKEHVMAMARDKLFLCHSKNDTLVGFDNFLENVGWLRLPKENQAVFNKGSHLMLRREPALVGLACKHFTGGEGT